MDKPALESPKIIRKYGGMDPHDQYVCWHDHEYAECETMSIFDACGFAWKEAWKRATALAREGFAFDEEDI